MNRILFALCLFTLPAFAQKTVLKYPFEFQKRLFERGKQDANFLNNGQTNGFALVLKDNLHANYILLDSAFKVVDTFSHEINNSFFKPNIDKYSGGTSNGNSYNFVYTKEIYGAFRNRFEYKLEIVDFDNKTIQYKPLFEVPKEEKQITAFGDNNMFYAITADDGASQLVFRQLDEKGNITIKKVPVKIPVDVSRKRNELSEYMNKTMVIQHNVEPDFSLVTTPSKIFSQPGKIYIVINESDHPSHVISVNLADFKVQEKFFDYKDLLSQNDKGNIYVNSYVQGNTLFSLILNKKNIRVAMFDLETSQLSGSIELNEDNYTTLISQPAITETRKGKKEKEKEVDSFKGLLKLLNKRTEGLMVTTGKAGQLVITVGTYDYLEVPVGSASGRYGPHAGIGGYPVGNPNFPWYYTPGKTFYSSNDARYYTSTQFRLLVDPVTYKTKRGRTPVPVSDQIKNYLETMAEKDTKATTQFGIGDKQYFGYYNKDMKAYQILQIRVTK